MWHGKGKTAIVGIGYSELVRQSKRPLGLLALDACREAIADAGLSPQQIDGLATYPEAPFLGAGTRDGVDIVSVAWIINHLALAPDVRWYAQIETGMIAAPVIEGAHALMAGACDYVLIWRALHQPRSYGAFSGARAAGDAQFLAPFGCVGVIQSHAMAWRRYMHQYGATREHLCTFVVNSRRNANLNPRAFFYTKPMTREDYFAARPIAEPFCLFDCDVPVEGCVALVMTSAERARDLRHPPAYIAGHGQNTVEPAQRCSSTRSTTTSSTGSRSRASCGRRRDSAPPTWTPRSCTTASARPRSTGWRRPASASGARPTRSSRTAVSRWRANCR